MSNEKQSVRDAAAAVRRAEAEQARIQKAIASVQPGLQASTAGPAVLEARLAYEAAAADMALGHATEAQAKAARAQLDAKLAIQQDAAAAAQLAVSAVAGLQSKLSEASAAVQDAAQALVVAEAEYLRAELAVADAAYIEAAGRVDVVLRRVRGLKAALTLRRYPTPPGDGLIEFHAIDRQSAGKVIAATGAAHGWGVSIFPRANPATERAAIEAELAAAAEGVMSRVRSTFATT